MESSRARRSGVGARPGVTASGRSLPGQNKDTRITALRAAGSPAAFEKASTLSRGDIYSGLTQLGQKTTVPASPAEAVLERVPNPHSGTRYAVRFTAPEFTSLCPMTSQPDFAHLVIDYVPGEPSGERKPCRPQVNPRVPGSAARIPKRRSKP